MDDAIAGYIAKGMTRKQACATLGIPYTPEIQHSSIDKDSLRDMAINTLASLIKDMQTSPAAFKPNEIIAACKEALDRTEGKAAQSITVDNKATITHEHILRLEPSEAYKRMIEGSLEVIEHIT